MIANAPWAARVAHTTVIDAAGAIYVIGGMGSTFYSDVWVSTSKGTDRTRFRVTLWYWRVLYVLQVLRGYAFYSKL